MTVPLVGNAASPQSAGGGGEIIDGGTFVGGPPEHIDPALNTTLDAYQVINALYDGLTDVDSTDPENTADRPAARRVVRAQRGRHGVDVHDQGGSAVRRRRADPAEHVPALVGAGVEPGLRRRLQLPASTSSTVAPRSSPVRRTRSPGVVADDEAMTLTVTMDAPYSNFDAVAGFQLFFPMPEAADESPRDYENELMVGNGPYMLESPRTDEEIVLVRNENWAGDFNGETWPDRAERIVFRVDRRPGHLVQRPRGRRGRHRQHPAGSRRRGAVELGHHARRQHPRLVPLRHQLPRPAGRWRREPAAAPGDLDGDRPRRRSTRPCTTACARSRPASRLRASPASPRACATTAPTTPKAPRRRTTSGWRPATSRR